MQQQAEFCLHSLRPSQQIDCRTHTYSVILVHIPFHGFYCVVLHQGFIYTSVGDSHFSGTRGRRHHWKWGTNAPTSEKWRVQRVQTVARGVQVRIFLHRFSLGLQGP